MHIKRIHEMMEDLTAYAECEVKKAIECEDYDVNVIGGIIDMVKDLADAEKNARIAKAMQTEEEDEEAEEKYILRMFIDKMGEDDGRRFYDRWRYANGRFAPKGRGTRRGYRPYIYMMEDGYEDEYEFPKMPNYRMGYHMDDMRYDERRGGVMHDEHEGSRYGKSYDKYRMAKRHYTQSQNPEEQKKMRESIAEVFDDMEDITVDMVKDMSPEEKQKYRKKLQDMMQKIQ